MSGQTEITGWSERLGEILTHWSLHTPGPGGGVTMITKCSLVFVLPMIHYRYPLHTLMFDQALHVAKNHMEKWKSVSISIPCCSNGWELELDKYDARESSDWDKRSHSWLGSMSKLLLQLPHYHNSRPEPFFRVQHPEQAAVITLAQRPLSGKQNFRIGAK